MKKGRITKRRVRAALLTVFAACLLFAGSGSTPLATAATSESQLRSQISALQEQAKGYKSKKSDLRAQLSAITGQKNAALAKKAILDEELAYIEEEIENTNAQIAAYGELITEQELLLTQAQENEEAQYELFCERVRAMEESGSFSYWSVLFSSDSFSDLLDRLTVVNDVMEYDNHVIEQLKSYQTEVKDRLAELEVSKTAVEEQKASLVTQMQEQANRISEAMEVINALKKDEAEAKAAVEAEEAAAAAIERQIKAKEAELDKVIKEQKIAVGNGYIWPLKGYFTLTSRFGPRTHPITGQRNKMHNGVDIAAPKNTPIYAAKGGIVSISAYDSSYGNYVVISHGNGNTTLYAHMNKRGVSAGATVTQGQVIGYVGTTGSSNGYHLHYEIRENGERINPISKYPNVSFVKTSSY